MKSKYYFYVFIVLIVFSLFISCKPETEVPSEISYSTPTIKGTISLPSGSNVNPSEVYVKVVDESGNTAKVDKVNSDKTFVIQGLKEGTKYSILFTSEEPDHSNMRGLLRDPDKSNGVGGWIHDVVPEIVTGKDVGSVKLKPLGTIKGKVFIEGASEHYDITVYIPGTSYIAKTDKDGSFNIYNVPEGKYTLRYTLDDHLPIMLSDVMLVCPEDVEKPEVNVKNVTLKSSLGSVEGRAILGDSNDSTGVKVNLESEDKSLTYPAFTSKDGYYTISGIQPGRYRTIVSYDGYTSQMSSYFDVTAGTLTKADTLIELYSSSGYLKGTVSLNDSDTKSGIAVTIRSKDNGNTFTVMSDEGGAFTKRLKPGTYTVDFSHSDYSSYTVDATVVENNTTTLNAVTLYSIYGTITGRSFSPEETITLIDKDGNPIQTLQSSNDCTYKFSGIQSGTYNIRFSKTGFASSIITDVVVAPLNTIIIDGVELKSVFGTLKGMAGSEGDSVSLMKDGVVVETVTVDSSRQYSFTGIEPGSYSVRFSREGYTPYESEIVAVSAASETIINGKVLISIYGTIKGTSASEGETVYLVRNGVQVESSTTLENKEYIFTNIQQGEYSVRFTKNGYRTYESEAITVKAGDSYVIDGQKLVSMYGAVAGFVFLSGSDDYSGVTVTLTSSESMTSSFVETTAADGSFRFSDIRESGIYLLTYSKDGYVTDNTKSVEVTVGSVASAGAVTLKSTASALKGSIQLEGASSYENVTVLLRNDANQYTTTTDQKGGYVLNRVLPGTYTLLASKDGYVTSTPLEIVVEPSSEKTIEDRILSVAIRSVTGKVTLELLSDYSGVLVTATNLSDNTLVYSAITNSNGDFTLAGMKPGEYSVVISCNGYRTVTLPTINIVASTTTSLPVTNMLINRGTVSGTATLEGRSSSEGIKVELLKGSDIYADTTTDESGNYSFYVPQGNYSGVRYSKPDFASSSVSRNIALFADNYVSMGDTELKATHNTLTGKVDVLTTDDEAGVTISFDGVDSITAYTTTTEGEFSFEHIPVGSYVMRFERTDCSDITVPVNVTAADVISLGTVTITPNTATIKGTIVLKDGLSSEVVSVSIDMGGKTLQTTTDSSGRYEIGGVSIADEYTVTYSKDGWDTNTQTISPKLDLLEIREMPEIVLVDTTAPVLKSVTINNGANTAADRNVVLHIDAEDGGSGLNTMMVYDYSNPQYLGSYSSLSDWTFESSNGLKTVYVKVIDRTGNESNVVSAQVILTDQKKEVKGVLKGDDLTWTKEMSPYLVTGNLLVEKDDTLSIEPGVDVQFSGDYYLQIEGRLSAIGTEDERIKIYGIDDADDYWDGMNFINDNDSTLSYVDISGLKNGIVGYCDIDHALITSNGWAVGIEAYFYPDDCLKGSITDSTINGSVSVAYDNVKGNSISGSTTIWYSNIEGNTFSGSKLDTRYSFVYNNTVNSSTVYSCSDIQKFVTYNDCTLHLGHNCYNEYEIAPSGLYNIQFNKCSFPMFAADVKDSNFINCGPITVESGRTARDSFICTGNYWGDINTVEVKSRGESQNLSFITDYYDDFNKSRVDYRGYKESAIENAGYHGQEPDGPYSGYSIGDKGPAGGLVFYDKGYYSDGWRYFEAAPEDIGSYVFGYYRPDGTNNNMVGTAQAIGTGRYNTERLVEYMDIGGKAYSSSYSTEIEEYAAKKCLDYSYGGYEDWFLPSKEELNLMYQNLQKKGLGSFANYYYDYWSSSNSTKSDAWEQCFVNGIQYYSPRNSTYCVRAVRAF